MPDPTPEQKATLDLITRRFQQADTGVHKRFRERAEHFYALYRNYTDWRGSLPSDRRDRDLGLTAAKREWGAELFIPYAFSTVETILPRMLSNRPSIIVRPRRSKWENNVRAIKLIIQAQQEQIDYELILQDIAKDALIYGLGVQKVFWKTERQAIKRLARPTVPRQDGPEWVAEDAEELFDDPMVERVDPLTGFFWDPYGDGMNNIEWCIHRTFRSGEYVKRMLKAQAWTGLAPDKVGQQGASAQYTEAVQNRMRISGYPNFRADGDVHEVWEYHDRARVVTVLNRQTIVQEGPNPSWKKQFPFQVYRPTKVGGQFAGIGEIEPIEDLQAEINTLRSQRRDNATFVLQRAFFYSDGMIDPADFKVGPGKGIPVLGNPSESIFPVQIGDIPHSGYQEEQNLQADIERTTGIDDSLSGSGQVGQTATGVQLVQAAANLRIQQKTRRCEVELVRAGGRQFLALNQQKIRTNREVRIPAPPTPEEPDRRWAWLQVGPEDLMGEFDIDIEGGSMAPDNVPQKRQDGQAMLALLQSNSPIPINREKGTEFVLESMDIENAEAWIEKQPPPPPIDPKVAEALQRGGVDPELIKQAVAAVVPPQT